MTTKRTRPAVVSLRLLKLESEMLVFLEWPSATSWAPLLKYSNIKVLVFVGFPLSISSTTLRLPEPRMVQHYLEMFPRERSEYWQKMLF